MAGLLTGLRVVDLRLVLEKDNSTFSSSSGEKSLHIICPHHRNLVLVTDTG